MVSAVLLIPTGLFLKSLVNLMHVDLGMKTENVIGFSVSPALNGYKNGADPRAVRADRSRDGGDPGRQERGGGLVPLIAGNNWGNDVKIAGAKDTQADYNSRFNEVGPGILRQDGHPADRRARVHRERYRWPGRRWRWSTRPL